MTSVEEPLRFSMAAVYAAAWAAACSWTSFRYQKEVSTPKAAPPMTIGSVSPKMMTTLARSSRKRRALRAKRAKRANSRDGRLDHVLAMRESPADPEFSAGELQTRL